MFKNLILLGIALILTLLMLNGCATNTQDAIRNFCQIYQPVYTTAEDTELTKKQVDRNNASYDCLCGHGECPDPDK